MDCEVALVVKVRLLVNEANTVFHTVTVPKNIVIGGVNVAKDINLTGLPLFDLVDQNSIPPLLQNPKVFVGYDAKVV
jgi:hypothetical protein